MSAQSIILQQLTGRVAARQHEHFYSRSGFAPVLTLVVCCTLLLLACGARRDHTTPHHPSAARATQQAGDTRALENAEEALEAIVLTGLPETLAQADPQLVEELGLGAALRRGGGAKAKRGRTGGE